MLANGAALVSTDISDEMLKIYKQKFEQEKFQSDFNKTVIRCEEFVPIGNKNWDLETELKKL